MTACSKNLSRARMDLHLSREYVAERMNITEEHLSSIESGATPPTPNELVEFSRIYMRPIEHLRGRHRTYDEQAVASLVAFQDSLRRK